MPAYVEEPRPNVWKREITALEIAVLSLMHNKESSMNFREIMDDVDPLLTPTRLSVARTIRDLWSDSLISVKPVTPTEDSACITEYELSQEGKSFCRRKRL